MLSPGAENTEDIHQLVGRTVAGRFRLEEYAGAGRMGHVYRAKTVAGDEAVAVRILALDGLVPQQAIDSFVRKFSETTHHASQILRGDAQVARGLGSGMTIAANGTNVAYTVQEWFDGRPLSALLAERSARKNPAPSLAQAVDLLTPAVEAIAYAHDLGLFHGHLTPGALFVTRVGDRDLLKILDFGIAQAVSDLVRTLYPSLSIRHLVAPAYAAPERLEPSAAQPVGPWTDVYALAIILMEMVQGSAVQRDGSNAPVLGATNFDGRRLVVERAIARAARDRWQDVGEFWEALTSSDDAGTMRPAKPSVPTGALPSARPTPIEPSALQPTAMAPAPGPATSRWAPEARTNPSQRPVLPALSSARPTSPPVPTESGETFFEVLPPPHLLAAIQEALAGPPGQRPTTERPDPAELEARGRAGLAPSAVGAPPQMRVRTPPMAMGPAAFRRPDAPSFGGAGAAVAGANFKPPRSPRDNGRQLYVVIGLIGLAVLMVLLLAAFGFWVMRVKVAT